MLVLIVIMIVILIMLSKNSRRVSCENFDQDQDHDQELKNEPFLQIISNANMNPDPAATKEITAGRAHFPIKIFGGAAGRRSK